MKHPFFLLLLGCSALTAQASPTAELGLWLLLGEPAAVSQGESVARSGKEAAPASLSLHFSQPLGTLTNFFGTLSHATNRENPIKGATESSMTAFQGGIEWMLGQPQKMQWFLLGGMGGTHVQHGSKQEAIQPVISVGVGQNWSMGAQDALRWELRANQNVGHESQPNWTPVNFQAIFSYQWGN